jgi:large subunit ribosomal protein L7/L12
MSSREERLKAEIALLRHKQKQIEAKKGEKQRKDDTRRRILLGSLVLQSHKNGLTHEWLKALDQFLTRDYDRKLFNLPSKVKSGE